MRAHGVATGRAEGLFELFCVAFLAIRETLMPCLRLGHRLIAAIANSLWVSRHGNGLVVQVVIYAIWKGAGLKRGLFLGRSASLL